MASLQLVRTKIGHITTVLQEPCVRVVLAFLPAHVATLPGTDVVVQAARTAVRKEETFTGVTVLITVIMMWATTGQTLLQATFVTEVRRSQALALIDVVILPGTSVMGPARSAEIVWHAAGQTHALLT